MWVSRLSTGREEPAPAEAPVLKTRSGLAVSRLRQRVTEDKADRPRGGIFSYKKNRIGAVFSVIALVGVLIVDFNPNMQCEGNASCVAVFFFGLRLFPALFLAGVAMVLAKLFRRGVPVYGWGHFMGVFFWVFTFFSFSWILGFVLSV